MASDTIITIENLGKRYRLGASRSNERYTALRDVVAEAAVRPFLNLKDKFKSKNGNAHLSSPSASTSKLNSEGSASEFWALKNVSFEVKQGEVVGIIGRNGAGKSTLLKILSRITEPTEGRIKIKGRVASLLEVGTGFHPELTGRENIFLNGAILGMHRHEIKAKFDEIVAFAEIEKFLDTPVKRYSSGMYVRLAFAVAAHLEPEILIVDEVLAVGDAEFQKKCLGKMQSVAKGEGRTVLFVSHNMGVISTLCPSVGVIDRGALVFFGAAADGIGQYVNAGVIQDNVVRPPQADGKPTITSVAILHGFNEERPGISFRLQITSKAALAVSLEIIVHDALGAAVGFASAGLLDSGMMLNLIPGKQDIICRLATEHLARGTYRLSMQLAIPMIEVVDSIKEGLVIEFERSA
ncbi:MAG: ABC transporter ATP-binding protein, partial [Acidobacteriota bacterium]